MFFKLQKFTKNSTRGLTLLELLIASTLTLIILGSVIMILMSSSQFFELTTREATLFNNGQFAMDEIHRELNKTFFEKLILEDEGRRISFIRFKKWDPKTKTAEYEPGTYTFQWRKEQRDLVLISPGDQTRVVANQVIGFKVFKKNNPQEQRVVVQLELQLSTYDKNTTPVTQKFSQEIFIVSEPK